MGDVRFGPYALLERVSVGGMAEVFRARRLADGPGGKLLAIKRILPSMIEDEQFRHMFTDEANIAGQLVHRNIARIYDHGTADSYPYIAMEYVWGKDLLQIQNRFRRLRQRMPVAMACHIVIKICEALDYAHRKHDAAGKPMLIVHRDCSPQNVIVSYKGDVKLVDFGIAKAAERLTMTAAGDVKGKLSYMAPEQIAGKPLDRRVDVYGVGVVLFELLLGDRLIAADSEVELVAKARAGILPKPRAVMPDLPPALEAIILTAVARDVGQRYGWCSELRNALVAFLSESGQAFDSDDLSIWLKGAFAQEMMRETEDLETLPTYEGHLGPSEFDDRTVADVGFAAPLGLSHGNAPSMREVAVPAAGGTASRRMAATVPRAELGSRLGVAPHLPSVVVAAAAATLPASPTKVLPRMATVPPPVPPRASASAVASDESDEMEETMAHIAVTVGAAVPAPPRQALQSKAPPIHGSPMGVPPRALGTATITTPRPAGGRPSTIAPAVTATVSIVAAAPKRPVWLGVVIGVAIAAVILLIFALMVA